MRLEDFIRALACAGSQGARKDEQHRGSRRQAENGFGPGEKPPGGRVDEHLTTIRNPADAAPACRAETGEPWAEAID